FIILFNDMPSTLTHFYTKPVACIRNPVATHSSRTLDGTVASSAPRAKEKRRWLTLRMLAAKTCTWPSPLSYIVLIFLTRSMPSSPRSSSLPTKGDTYTGSLDPFVAAYTAAACSCEKHSVMLTRILLCTDICAARKPSCVHGYLT